MTPAAHAAFTAALLERLSADADVLGLVTLGSSSGLPPPPDAFSDHDFFVVTRAGAQERFRGNLAFLPDAADIVLQLRETAHGLKVLYASGHLVEFAVFDLDELALARVNRYAVLLDRADVAARMAATRAVTVAEKRNPVDEAWHAGQLLTCLAVAVGRAARGEWLSGQELLRAAARHLLTILHARHRGDPDSPLDDLDPHRRLELALPRAGAAAGRALRLPVDAAARALLEIAEDELPGLTPPRARAALESLLARATPASAPPLPPLRELDLTLRSPRLVLRPLAADDVDTLWPLVSEPELPRFMSWTAHTERAQTEAWVRRTLDGRAAGTEVVWVIEHQGALSGVVGLHGISPPDAWRAAQAELGYWLAPRLWGRGLVSEAAAAATRFGFEQLRLHKITTGCVDENVASRRIIDKLGFRFVGRLVDDVWRDGRWLSLLRYELLARDVTTPR